VAFFVHRSGAMNLKLALLCVVCVETFLPSAQAATVPKEDLPFLDRMAHPSEFRELDDLDKLTIILEQDRLLFSAGLMDLPEGYANHFWAVAISYLEDNPEVTFATLETRFRKWKTGMYLIAVNIKNAPKNLGPDQSYCLRPLKGRSLVQLSNFWIYLSAGTTEMNEENKKKYGFINSATNLQNLEKAQVLAICYSVPKPIPKKP